MNKLDDVVLEYVKNHYSSDTVKFTKKTDKAIQEWWISMIGVDKGISKKNNDGSYNTLIPSDLIMGMTIPIMDVIIDVEGEETIGRVIIFNEDECVHIMNDVDKNRDRINKMITDENLPIDKVSKDANLYVVGAVNIRHRLGIQFGYDVYIPICIFEGLDILFSLNTIIFGKCNPIIKNVIKENPYPLTYWAAYMMTWYGIQLSMLHPLVKNVYKNGEFVKRKSNDPFTTKSSKQPTKYIQRHIILDENFIENSYKESGYKYERKTMLWWVAGHWHTYGKNKEKKFVKGYWKGPLRETGALEEPRERAV